MSLSKRNHKHVRYDVLTVVLVFWDVTPNELVFDELRVYAAQEDLNMQLQSI
jgi:hypothetical protein